MQSSTTDDDPLLNAMLSTSYAGKIWRFMTFAKLMAMLEGSSVRFTRADLLGDSHEGSWPKKNLTIRPSMNAAFAQTVTGLSVSEEMKKAWLRTDAVSGAAAGQALIRKMVFVSCWLCSDYEPKHMWDIFGKEQTSIVIKCDFTKLFRIFQKWNVRGFEVRYIDYDHEEIPHIHWMSPYVYKRREHHAENELRFTLVWRHDGKRDLIAQSTNKKEEEDEIASLNKQPSGYEIQIPLAEIIEEVRIAPNAPAWFSVLLRKILLRYGVMCEVNQSAMDRSPDF